ncbi:juvenile hormone esterase-like [Culicoides brevitarsis]|uniref:juvenile hormone esterase-like n=1 Tax=Culicoides brevitarsis TaxID=469753 RepID=UPI00307BEA09
MSLRHLQKFKNVIFSGKVRHASHLSVTLKHNGKVEGEKLRGEILANEYLSWKGIPYGKPPVEELRFKAPVPHSGWIGSQKATKHGNVCIQKLPSNPSKVVGDEDCLFLNVYTPTKREGPLPVMVWVHGGAFSFGSGDADYFSPELLVNEDVIVVTFNYRLGVLGFLGTEDKHSQGNYGLKDIAMACEWVKDNIGAFGGDSEKITLFGESGGAMMIHSLLLSPMNRGLFQKAILQSGTSALSSCFLQPKPLERASELARYLNIKYKTTEQLVHELKRTDAVILAQNVPSWINREIPNGKLPLAFSPCIEPEDSLEPRILPESPTNLLRKNVHPDIPMIVGVNSAEGLYAVSEWQNNACLFGILNDEPEHLLPNNWNVDPNSAVAKEILNDIYRVYFNNEPIRNVTDYVKYVSDSQWNYGPYSSVCHHLEHQKSPIYFYVFSFSGDLSINKIKKKLKDYEGVIHGDDVPYLFPMARFAPKMTQDNPAFVTRARMVKMWANFAKHENPTPSTDSLLNVNWSKVEKNSFNYLDIGEKLEVKVDPFEGRLKIWQKMDEKFQKS